MASQGGSHEQHVKAGKQSHKNSDTKQASMTRNHQDSSDRSSKASDQRSKGGQGTQKGKH